MLGCLDRASAPAGQWDSPLDSIFGRLGLCDGMSLSKAGHQRKAEVKMIEALQINVYVQ